MASKKMTIPEKGAAINAAPETRVSLVICAYRGTEDKMQVLWRKALPASFAFKIVSVDETQSRKDVLSAIMEDPGIADSFVCVPANTFPTSPLQPEELRLPVVYVDKKGRRQYDHRLPQSFDKHSLAELMSVTFQNDEAFFRAAAAHINSRPVEVGHSFGNFVTMVLRGTPCEHEVIAGMLPSSGRKYIAASHSGWRAIEHLVDECIGRDCP